MKNYFAWVVLCSDGIITADDFVMVDAESAEEAARLAKEKTRLTPNEDDEYIAIQKVYVETDYTPMSEYTGVHYVGELVYHGTHECKVTAVWADEENRNGISIIPTGGYGFEVDIYEEQL